MLLPDQIDLVHSLLDAVLVVLAEAEEVLNVLIFGVVSQADPLLDSVLHQLIHILRLLMWRHCLHPLLFLSQFLSLLYLMIHLALDFGNSPAFDLLIEDHCAMLASLD